jgi:uncharacterized protein involved in response to NO
LHVKQYPSRIKPIIMMTAFMTAAAITRIGADFSAHREILLMVAALAWSCVFILALLIQLDCLVNAPARQKSSRTLDGA